MKTRALIIDDELTSVETLKGFLSRYCPNLTVLGYADGVKSGLEAINFYHPDLIFLDIEMKDGSGFDLIEQLTDTLSFQVIFITAYDHYAVKAFRYCALDYLLKPVDPDLLIEAVEKVTKVTETTLSDKLNVFRQSKNRQEKIILPSKDELFIANIKDIIRCESKGNYTLFFFKDQKSQLVCKSLKEYDDLLCDLNFLRVHKSHLINLDYVERYLQKDNFVVMKDGAKVEVSRRKKDVFLHHLFNQ